MIATVHAKKLCVRFCEPIQSFANTLLLLRLVIDIALGLFIYTLHTSELLFTCIAESGVLSAAVVTI